MEGVSKKDAVTGDRTTRGEGGSLVVNHVLSSETQSAIFNAIFGYFRRYVPAGITIEVSERPLPHAAVHHFHRPHLESDLGDRAVVTEITAGSQSRPTTARGAW